jgi:hypothetical protein
MVLFSRNWKIILFFIILSLVPAIITIGDIYNGRIAFWFDPARDFLLALQNHSNPTLIGQPSGIPGVFYGPYWIWFISFLMLIFKDPRVISFFLLTLPYFLIFPFFLYQITKKLGLVIFFSLWLLFILNFNGYANQIWNINLFPLFILSAVYFSLEIYIKQSFSKLFLFTSGILTGLASSFHLSLGIPLILGIGSFHILSSIIFTKGPKTTRIKISLFSFLLFLVGLIISYTPFILFELRHSFQQISTFINTVKQSLVYDLSVVGQTGLSDQQIIAHFFERLNLLLGLQSAIAPLVMLVLLGLFIASFKKKNFKLDRYEVIVLLLIFISSFWIFLIFLINNNPIWEYHFRGLEILFMLLLGVIAKNALGGRLLLAMLALISLSIGIYNLPKNLEKNNFKVTDLATERQIVKLIVNDANPDFNYQAYSSAIHTYEYDYLFKFYNDKKLNANSANLYLIIPKSESSVEQDFINYKAPSDKFDQIRTWEIPDGTTVYRMRRIE